MSRDIWAEIDRLRAEVQSLERQLAAQYAVISQHPPLRIGDVSEIDDTGSTRSYTIQARTVAATRNEIYQEVKVLPGDPGPASGPVAMYVDENGERYILPTPGRIILVYDNGDGTGYHVEKNESGTVTTPAGSATLNLVTVEPTTKFFDSTPPWQAGRIHPGMKLATADGSTFFYQVFLAGHGAAQKNHDALIDGTTLRIQTDYAGKFVSWTTV